MSCWISMVSPVRMTLCRHQRFLGRGIRLNMVRRISTLTPKQSCYPTKPRPNRAIAGTSSMNLPALGAESDFPLRVRARLGVKRQQINGARPVSVDSDTRFKIRAPDRTPCTVVATEQWAIQGDHRMLGEMAAALGPIFGGWWWYSS